MKYTVENLATKAKELARLGDDEKAMSIADALIQEHPNDSRSWSLRAYLHARNSHYRNAIADVTQAIGASPAEPSLFFDRGRYEIALGQLESAIEDFSHGLKLCDDHKDDYYRETLHFFRADALIKVGKTFAAAEDLKHVRDDFRLWTDSLRTKEDLLDELHKRSK
jgi:tetratricopeptide (TPR) repeat protein